MIPTEHEGTVAVDAAARTMFAAARDRAGSIRAGAHSRHIEWDDLEPLRRNQWLEAALPIVWAALEALPDRAIAARAEVIKRVEDHCCTCGCPCHEDWCPAFAVIDLIAGP